MDNVKVSSGAKFGSGSVRGAVITKYPLLRNYCATGEQYEFVLEKKGERVFLNDQGRTYKMLNQVFELKEEGVLKNLVAILRNYKEVRKDKNGAALFIEVIPWNGNKNLLRNDELHRAFLTLFACVSFMEDMRIFYV
jgi:hypothetical protein